MNLETELERTTAECHRLEAELHRLTTRARALLPKDTADGADAPLEEQLRCYISDLIAQRNSGALLVEQLSAAYMELCGAIGEIDEMEDQEAVDAMFEVMREGHQLANIGTPPPLVDDPRLTAFDHIVKALGCEDDPMACWEHVEALQAQRDALKQEAIANGLELTTQRAIVRDLCGLLGLRVYDFHCVRAAREALDTRDRGVAAKAVRTAIRKVVYCGSDGQAIVSELEQIAILMEEGNVLL